MKGSARATRNSKKRRESVCSGSSVGLGFCCLRRIRPICAARCATGRWCCPRAQPSSSATSRRASKFTPAISPPGERRVAEDGTPPNDWNEAQYLKIYPDVAAEVQRGTFVSGYHHYLVAGRAEGRNDGKPPSDWNEALYLQVYPDVAAEVQRGTFVSGYHHYLVAGRAEGRNDGTPPKIGTNKVLNERGTEARPRKKVCQLRLR